MALQFMAGAVSHNTCMAIALNDDNMVTANTCDCQQVVIAFGEKIECFPTGSEEAERISNSMLVYSKKIISNLQ